MSAALTACERRTRPAPRWKTLAGLLHRSGVRFAGHLLRRLARHRTARALMALDSRGLKDIGLSRGAIDGAAEDYARTREKAFFLQAGFGDSDRSRR